jgi:predicted DNA-binding transcriptional regulator YafY
MIGAVLPDHGGHDLAAWPLYASRWHAMPPARVDLGVLRRAVRDEARIALAYADTLGRRTARTVLPIALLYYVEAVVLAAWCELRADFRHFRVDRIVACTATGTRFGGQGGRLRARRRERHHLA